MSDENGGKYLLDAATMSFICYLLVLGLYCCSWFNMHKCTSWESGIVILQLNPFLNHFFYISTVMSFTYLLTLFIHSARALIILQRVIW